MSYRFSDRTEAGQALAQRLNFLAKAPNIIVLALPRGGVPVGFEIAKALQAPFDIFLVRKLGAPWHEEFAIGALAENGVRFVNQETVNELRISDSVLEQITQREQQELDRRKQQYRGHHLAPNVTGKTVILVDDGLATGATMKAAIQALRVQHPEKIIVAIPVGPTDTCAELKQIADDLVCIMMPTPFFAVGQGYQHFPQLSDSEVISLLTEARSLQKAGAGSDS